MTRSLSAKRSSRIPSAGEATRRNHRCTSHALRQLARAAEQRIQSSSAGGPGTSRPPPRQISCVPKLEVESRGDSLTPDSNASVFCAKGLPFRCVLSSGPRDTGYLPTGGNGLPEGSVATYSHTGKGPPMEQAIVVRVTVDPQKILAELVEQGAAQGVFFLRRLMDDWVGGARRFDSPGEGLFVVIRGSRPVAVCALERERLFSAESTGCLRCLYVSIGCRRAGTGRFLANQVIEQATESFDTLKVNASTKGLAAFFESMGFEPTEKPNATHYLNLRTRQLSNAG